MEFRIVAPDNSNWQELALKIAVEDWDAAKYLAKQMQEGQFSDWERVLVAMDGDKLIGFASIVKEDIVKHTGYTPFIATVYVNANYRGKRISEQLVHLAEKTLQQQGFNEVYIATIHSDLYEKYGYQYLATKPDIFERAMRLYKKTI